MALPSTGSISLSQVAVELSRPATAQTALGEAAVRNLAGLPSGAIGLFNLRGKSAAIIYTATNLASLNLATAFGADYGAAVDKRLVVPAGITLGPITIPTGLGGNLTVENAGEIQGIGGAANGGAGGDAITASVSFTLLNTGAVRGGGGGGGLGGTGGQGSITTTSTIREPASGHYYVQGTWGYFPPGFGIRWNSTSAVDGVASPSMPYTASNGWTYHADGSYGMFPPGVVAPFPVYLFGVYRTQSTSSSSYTAGGAGGAGGRGRGYGQTLAAGGSGASGGTNAGTGGAGGTGGDWGQAGAGGSAGANGNQSGGTAGASGGAAGRAVRMLAGSLTLTNSGTINGAT
jgi:hypothetical protein